MSARLSKSQIERLGLRLVGKGGPSDEDLTIVGEALAVADMIDAVEVGEVVAPDDRDLPAYRREVEDALGKLRQTLHDIDDANDVVEKLGP